MLSVFQMWTFRRAYRKHHYPICGVESSAKLPCCHERLGANLVNLHLPAPSFIPPRWAQLSLHDPLSCSPSTTRSNSFGRYKGTFDVSRSGCRTN